jgi:hypothetical protein
LKAQLVALVALLLASRAVAQQAELQGSADPDDEVIDVTVEGDARPRPETSLDKEEVRSLPGAFGDPFRAIEAMPGVTPLVSGVPYFYVRGAPPGNVGYFFDEVRVPVLFHVALGPSVIHPVLIDAVELHSGAYPARYGRFSGGIVTARAARPPPSWRGEASIRLFDAGAMLTAPLPPEGRGSATLAGRYSYTAAIFSVLQPNVKLDYWDYQSLVSYHVGPRDELSLLVFGAGDFLQEKGDEDAEPQTLADVSFHRLDLRWDHRANASTRSRLATTVGLDYFGGDLRGVRNRMVGFRGSVDRLIDGGAVVRAGADANIDSYDTAASIVDIESLPLPGENIFSQLFFQSRDDLSTGIWAELSQPAGRATFVPGLRVDYYTFGSVSQVAVDPRLSVDVRAHEDIGILSTIGVAHQPPSFAIAIPGLAIGGVADGLQRSLQSSFGVAVDLPWDLRGRATLFQNTFFRLSDPLAVIRRVDSPGIAERERMLGSARGLELQLERPLSHRIGGFFAYTLSRSERVFRRERFAAAFDRTHVVQSALSWNLGKGWRAGTRMVFYTGFPAPERQPSGLEPIDEPSLPRATNEETPRTLPFFRVDLRLEKRWRILDRGFVALVFEVLNATARREVIDVECTTGRPCQPVYFGPVTIPSIGVEGGFF